MVKRKQAVDTGHFDRMCKCGHSMGCHTRRKPFECLAADARLRDCPCEAFKASKPKRTTKK
jgi:hypothetical protein